MTKENTYNEIATDWWIDAREDSIEMVRDERRKQLMKWGVQTHTDGTWLKIISEELGEVAKQQLDVEFGRNSEEIEIAKKKLLAEAVQLAAVSTAYVQQLRHGSA